MNLRTLCRLLMGVSAVFSVATFAAPPSTSATSASVKDFKAIGKGAYSIFATSARLSREKLAKFLTAINETEVEASKEPLSSIDGEKVIAQLEEIDGSYELQIDLNEFNLSLVAGSAFRVVSQTYLQIAGLSPNLVYESVGREGRTVDDVLRGLNRSYYSSLIQANIQINIHLDGKQKTTPNREAAESTVLSSSEISQPQPAPHSETVQSQPAPKVVSPASTNADLLRALERAQQVLDRPEPTYIPRSTRPDYGAKTEELVAPYKAAAALIRAQNEVRDAREESKCVCSATCQYHTGIVGSPHIKTYSPNLGKFTAYTTKIECQKAMRSSCNDSSIGQGEWGKRLVNESYSRGCK